jgi:hypothetical protein
MRRGWIGVFRGTSVSVVPRWVDVEFTVTDSIMIIGRGKI